MSDAEREMTLKEWCGRLHDSHLVNRQYQQLQQTNQELLAALEMLHYKLENDVGLTPDDNNQVGWAITNAKQVDT